MMKKSISILLCVLLFLPCMQALGARTTDNYIQNGSFEKTKDGNPAGWLTYDYAVSRPSAPGEAGNILQNGDFEEFTDEQARDWTYQNAKYAKKSTWPVHGGVSAIAMTGGHISQSVPVQPSSSYLFSAWVYLDAANTSGISATIVFYNADGIPCGKRYYDSPVSATDEWFEITITARTAENASYAILYAYMSNAGGTCYYDDFRLYKLEEEAFRFQTDEVFYYADNNSGLATVFARDAAGCSVDFSVIYKGAVVDEKTNVGFSGNKAEWSFPLASLELKKEYTLTASVKKNGEILQSFEEAIYKYPRPSKLTKEGLYMDGDKVFDPVIAYHVYGEDYKEVSKAGINVIELSPDVNTIVDQLDKLKDAGLKALIALCNGPAWMKPAAHPGNIEHTRTIVSFVKDHPAVFGYYAMDEPFVRRDTEMIMEWMKESYKLIRDIDDVHPVYVCDAYDFALTSRYADIVACEPYTYSRNAGKVTGQMEMAMKNVKSGKPVYAILQTFSASGSSFFPSGQNVRDQVYRAFESGAVGIGYYSFSDAHIDSKTPLHKMTETWEGMTELAKNELPILFDCFAHKRYVDFGNSMNAERPDSLYYRSFASQDGKTVYVIAHNRSTAVKSINVPLVSANGAVQIGKYTAQPIGGQIVFGTGSIEASLAGGETRLYKVIPESTIDVSLLSGAEGSMLLSAEGETGAKDGTLYAASLSSGAEENMLLSTEDETGAKDGTQYMELPVKGAGILQRIDGLLPQKSYRLSLWYKGSVEESAKLEIKFLHHDENGFTAWDTYCQGLSDAYAADEKSYVEYFGSATADGGQWRELKLDFYTPKYANALTICVEAYKNDSFLAVDLLSLVELEELNLVKNGEFESFKKDKTLSGGWFAYDEYMKSYGNVKLENGCIQFLEGRQAANARQFVFLEEGKTYRLSFRYKNESGHAPSVGLFLGAANGNTITEWNTEVEAGVWKRYEAVFTAKETAKYTLWLSDKTAKGILSFDDVRLTFFETETPMILRETGKISGTGALRDVGVSVTLRDAAGQFDSWLYWKSNENKAQVISVYKKEAKKEMVCVEFLPGENTNSIRKTVLTTSLWNAEDEYDLKVFVWQPGQLNTLEMLAALQ